MFYYFSTCKLFLRQGLCSGSDKKWLSQVHVFEYIVPDLWWLGGMALLEEELSLGVGFESL